MPTYLRALNYFGNTCAHFLCTYVSTTTQDIRTDIDPADVKSDENQQFNTSGVASQNSRKSPLDNFLIGPQIIISLYASVKITKPHKLGLRYAVFEAGVYFGVLNGMKGQKSREKQQYEVQK